MLYTDSTDAFIDHVRSIEHRADECLKHFALLPVPSYIACWTILGATVYKIEENLKRFGPSSSEFRAAMINLSRYAPFLIESLIGNGMAPVPADWVPRWEPLVGGQAFRDLRVAADYDAFLASYPMWYRGQMSAELPRDDVVRFSSWPNSRDRQVSAFQKGLRRKSGMHQAVAGVGQVEPTEAVLRRYKRILDAAQVEGEHGFRYEYSYELVSRTFRRYTKRMEQIMRRDEKLDLGAYTLGTFKRFYAALQSICATHDFLCFGWEQRTGTYPISSAVLVKRRFEWARLLSYHSGVDSATTDQLLGDLTFSTKRLQDFHVFPFVHLDDQKQILALVPHFVLNSSPEDNILRTCSYLYESSHSLLSDDKAAVMREYLLETLKRFHCHHSLTLPDGSSEIDLLVEDLQSSTVLIAELKWYRKPSTYRERLRVDAEFERGYRRQLPTIQAFCRKDPEWLKHRKALSHSLANYENVFYLLIGRDHWTWFDPCANAFVVECEQFRLATERHELLNDAIRELCKYEWLPVEGEDFHVQVERVIVEGVGVESEIYYSGPPK